MGHQAILRGADAALTFRNHPLTVLAPERAPRLIMTCEERVAAIKACGVKDVTVQEFTRELAEMEPEVFVNSFLKRKGFRFSTVRCGANWRFGRGGAGDAAFLRTLGVDVEVAPLVAYKGDRVSSTRIRACLERGEIADANAMMGRRYEVRGMRKEGKGFGRKLGFPTINFSLEKQDLRLPHGVYEVEVDGMKGIANYGLAPTMDDRAWKTPVLEVHFPGKVVEDVRRETSDVFVELIRFVRPERKFDSVTDLQRQIAADCASCSKRTDFW